MKRFELVDGKSSKFWEVTQVGSDLELSWGRIGSDGQSQTKNFASPEKAALERDKLVRSKTKKGYALVSDDGDTAAASAPQTSSAPAPDSAPEEPGARGEPVGQGVVAGSCVQDPEDIMALPPKVLKKVHAWRGRPSAEFARAELKKQRNKRTAESLWAAVHLEGIEIAKTWLRDQREPVLNALELLTSETVPEVWDAEVQGAAGALVGYWAEEAGSRGSSAELRKTMARSQAASRSIVQLWVKQRGVLFATEATLKSLRLFNIQTYDLLEDLRRHLAASDEDDYVEAIRITTAAWDDMGSAQRAILAYLFPTEQAWTDAVLANHEALRGDWQLRMVAASTRTPDALSTADWLWTSTSRVPGRPVFFWTAVEAMGPALVPDLVGALGAKYPEAPRQRRAAEALSHIATDDALSGLLDHPDATGVAPAVAEAVERFPQRAMRLLAARSEGASAATRKRHEMLMRLAQSVGPAEPLRAAPEAVPEASAPETVEPSPSKPTKTSPQAASGAATPLPDEDTLVLSSKLQKMVHPRRGYPSGPALTPMKLAKAAKLWSKVHAEWKKLSNQPWTLAANPALIERTLALLSSPTPPPTLDADAQGLAATMLGRECFAQAAKALPFLVDLWLALGGVEGATEAGILAAAFRFESYEKPDLIPSANPAPAYDQPAVTHWVRLRTWLTSADSETYGQARDRAASMPDLDLTARCVRAFLFPTERAWVDEALDGWANAGLQTHQGYYLRRLVLSSITTPNQLAGVAAVANGRMANICALSGGRDSTSFASMLEGLGPDVLPWLIEWIDDPRSSNLEQTLAEACSLLPGDAAMDALLDRLDNKHAMNAGTEMVARFPRRAVRLLTARIITDGKRKQQLTALLRIVRASHPGAFDAVAHELSEAQRGVWTKLAGVQRDAPEASAEELPAILVAPPWTRKKKPKARKVLKLEPLEPEAKLLWREGEREVWSASHRVLYRADENPNWQAMLVDLRSGRMPEWKVGLLLLDAPEDIAFAAASSWYPRDLWTLQGYAKAAIARVQVRATEAMAYTLETSPALALPYIQPFDVPMFAPMVANAFMRLKSARKLAAMWFTRHVDATVVGLVPDAVGKSGKSQHAAEAVLRYLEAKGHGAALREAASPYGPDAVTAVEAIVTADARDVLPKKMPTLPAFWTMAALPSPLLKESGHALSAESVDHLGVMLAISKPSEPYAGLEDVQQTCTADSLARFAWALFEAWQLAAMPSKESWAFNALGFLGDDEVARRLTPFIRAWPGDGGHQRAVQGLEVLAAIGTDVALMHLYGIAQKVKFKGLQKHAREKIQQIAQERELTAEQLADRLVPDLGLDENGALTLDYGPRQFTVGFDESLKPFVREGGKLRKSLPKPGAKDDAELAPLAYKRFSALKKDARACAKQQIERLERAMVAQRSWSAEEFQRFFLEHPLVVHLARRLVWESCAGQAPASYFRVAEDGSLANLEDDEFCPPEGSSVTIAHALNLGEEVTRAWADVFADYEILQPFAQLGRETFAIEPSELEAKSLARFEGAKVHYGKVLGLEARGWRRADAEDGGVIGYMTKSLGTTGTASLELDPGMVVGMLGEFPEQTLGGVNVEPGGGYGGYVNPALAMALGKLTPIQFSELVRDLSLVVS